MGMYTELFMSCRLKDDKEVLLQATFEQCFNMGVASIMMDIITSVKKGT